MGNGHSEKKFLKKWMDVVWVDVNVDARPKPTCNLQNRCMIVDKKEFS